MYQTCSPEKTQAKQSGEEPASLASDLKQPPALHEAVGGSSSPQTQQLASSSTRNVFPAICQHGRSSTSGSTESPPPPPLACVEHRCLRGKQSKCKVWRCRKPLQKSWGPLKEGRPFREAGRMQRGAALDERWKEKAALAISWMNSSALEHEQQGSGAVGQINIQRLAQIKVFLIRN